MAVLQLIQVLSEGDAHPDVVDYFGDLPMHLAVRGQHIEAVKALLTVGSPINDRNSVGDTPVRCCACVTMCTL